MCYLVIFSGIIDKNTIGRDLAMVLMVNNSPANTGDVRDMSSILGQEDSLEKAMATTAVFWPGDSQGQRSLVGYSPWGCRRVEHD